MECSRCKSVGWDPTDDGLCPYCHRIVDLEEENENLKRIVESDRTVRVERMELEEGDHGCRFIVGKDHVVAEWRGDGIHSDTVFVEKPALTYFKTTTPFDRCVRMAMEMVHWEVSSAMLAGPGDGNLVEWGERHWPGEQMRYVVMDILEWLEDADPLPTNDKGQTSYTVVLPGTLLKVLVAHLKDLAR